MAIFDTGASAEIDALIRELSPSSGFESTLYAHVYGCYTAAKNHRSESGVDREMIQSLRQYKCQYDPEDMELLDDSRAIYMGVTNLKCRALQSWITDILLPAEDKPWTLDPTPVPDLPKRIQEIVINRLALEFEEGGLEAQDFEDLATEAKSIGLENAKEMAKDAAKGMEAKIADQLEQGGWRAAFEEFVVDLSIYPSAVLKGPVMRNERTMRWKDGKVVQSEETRLQTERLNPWDVYPSANSRNPQSGSYVIHVARMGQTDLHECIGLYGFNEIAIRSLIGNQPGGATGWLSRYDSCLDALEKVDSDAASPDQQYHCLVYYGKVPGHILLDYGIAAEDPHGTVECEIWICQGQVLRAITNPYPLGKRPIYTATTQIEPGSFWGRSLPSLLRDVQRTSNATARALIKNMAFSAGPITEYDADRLANEEDISALEPYRMYAVKSDPFNSGTKAFSFNAVENVSSRLIGVYDRFAKEADDVSGIPAYALGQPQTAGAGRTLGGLSLLLGNAAKGVKRIIASVDRGVTEPMISTYYLLNLIYSADDTIKADAQVMARGSSGLLQRELSQSRAIEVLQVITPYANLGIVPPETILLVLRDVVSSLGYPASELGLDDPKRLERLALALAQTQLENGVQGNIPTGAAAPTAIPPGITPAAPGTPIPTLDGRSSVPADPAAGVTETPQF